MNNVITMKGCQTELITVNVFHKMSLFALKLTSLKIKTLKHTYVNIALRYLSLSLQECK